MGIGIRAFWTVPKGPMKRPRLVLRFHLRHRLMVVFILRYAGFVIAYRDLGLEAMSIAKMGEMWRCGDVECVSFQRVGDGIGYATAATKSA